MPDGDAAVRGPRFAPTFSREGAQQATGTAGKREIRAPFPLPCRVSGHGPVAHAVPEAAPHAEGVVPRVVASVGGARVPTRARLRGRTTVATVLRTRLPGQGAGGSALPRGPVVWAVVGLVAAGGPV